MAHSFDRDAYPGQAKILFVGLPQSSHTQSWIDLLKNREFNVRLFGLATGMPPATWSVKTYVTMPNKESRRNAMRQHLYLPGRGGFLQKKACGILHVSPDEPHLARIIRDWRPDIVHTLGLDPASYFYFAVRNKFHLGKIGRWLVQIRGGSDLAFARHRPEARESIRQTISACDQVIFDNPTNARILEEIGIPRGKFAPIAPVPGSGGIELAAGPFQLPLPSRRERIIVWPKAYECRWSKALPVLAAIRTVWNEIQPCEIHLLASTPEVSDWIFSWPEEIRAHCHILDRIDREDFFSLLKRARVMLAPSLIDGMPNSLYEAMAHGAFPIVSPLETITPQVRNEENALFAGNLYPNEIAAAILRAMSDDTLIDKAAQNNLKLVVALADRRRIGSRVVEYYQSLLASSLPSTPGAA